MKVSLCVVGFKAWISAKRRLRPTGNTVVDSDVPHHFWYSVTTRDTLGRFPSPFQEMGDLLYRYHFRVVSVCHLSCLTL